MVQRIKVVELVSTIADAGAETIVKDLVLALDREKFDVRLVVTDEACRYESSANVRALVNNGIKIYCPYPVVKSSFVNKIYRAFWKLLHPNRNTEEYRQQYVERLLLEFNPNVMHVHSRLSILFPIATQIKDSAIFYSCYSVPTYLFNDRNHKNELDIAHYLVENNNLRFIAMHNDMRDELNQMFNVGNTIVLRNSISIKKYQAYTDTKEQTREQYGIPLNAFVVGHVGRMVYIKNQLYLVDVFAEVYRRDSNAYLILVGWGADKEKIVNKLHNLELDGHYRIFTSVDDLNGIYHAIDVFVFPSLFEGIPNVCIEAQAAGLRCVISNTITKDVCLSDRVVMADIHDNPSVWADIILDDSIVGEKCTDIAEFQLDNVVNNLEKLYMNEYV